jgi:hypothetical protein
MSRRHQPQDGIKWVIARPELTIEARPEQRD